MKGNGKPQVVKVGNVGVRIYHRTKLHRESGVGYDIYEVADYTSGVRRLRSFSVKSEALAEAQKIARQLSTGEATAATLTNSQAASFGRATEILRPSGARLEVAASVYAKAFEILGDDAILEACRFYKSHRADQVTRKRVADVVAELLETKKNRGASARYIQDLRARLNRFAEAFSVDVSTITTADIQKWLDGLKLAAQTAKNFRTVLRTFFNFAEARGYVHKGGNPVEDTERISTQGSAIEIFTPKEMAALLASAPKEFVTFLAIGAFAGLRAAEIERLEWSDVDLAGGFIHVSADDAKTASRRIVPILPNLAAWLKDHAKPKGNVWKGTPGELRDIRAVTAAKAETPWKDNGLRHSFVSYRLADTQNAAQVALEAGNSPAMVFKHYREVVKPDAAKAWFSIVP